jgi:transcriptional regulator with XRE-family HTH domain
MVEGHSMGKVLKFDGVGQAIAELREKAMLSQAALAKRIGCNKGLLSKYENNNLALPFSTIEKVAGELGYSPAVVVLYCLKKKYPNLTGSETGRLFDELVRELAPSAAGGG